MIVFFEVAIVGIALFAIPAKDMFRMVHFPHARDSISNNVVIAVSTCACNRKEQFRVRKRRSKSEQAKAGLADMYSADSGEEAKNG